MDQRRVSPPTSKGDDMNLHLCRAAALWTKYEQLSKQFGPNEPLTLIVLANWFDECERARKHGSLAVDYDGGKLVGRAS